MSSNINTILKENGVHGIQNTPWKIVLDQSDWFLDIFRDIFLWSKHSLCNPYCYCYLPKWGLLW